MKEIDYNEIDEKCIPLVKWFNHNNLPTQFSCSGHNEIDSRFYIMFTQEVTDENVVDLLTKYSNQYNHSPFMGEFLKWGRKIDGKIRFNWMYRIGFPDYKFNQKLALYDLKVLMGIK